MILRIVVQITRHSTVILMVIVAIIINRINRLKTNDHDLQKSYQPPQPTSRMTVFVVF